MDEPLVSPCDCALLVGLPLTEESFVADLAAEHKDFARSMARRWPGLRADALWRIAYAPLAATLDAAVTAAAASGVTTVREATYPDLVAALGRFHVVTLFVHQAVAETTEGPAGVELADRIHDDDAMHLAIPPGWNGVLDLTMCVSAAIGEVIRRHTDAGVVIVNRHETSIRFRAWKYLRILHELRSTAPRRYSDVVIATTRQLLGAC